MLGRILQPQFFQCLFLLHGHYKVTSPPACAPSMTYHCAATDPKQSWIDISEMTGENKRSLKIAYLGCCVTVTEATKHKNINIIKKLGGLFYTIMFLSRLLPTCAR